MQPIHQRIAKTDPARAAELERQFLAKQRQFAGRLRGLQRAAGVCTEHADMLTANEREFVHRAARFTQESYGALTEREERMLFALEFSINERLAEEEVEIDRPSRFPRLVN